MKHIVNKSYIILLKVLFFVAVIILVKLLVHRFGFELISINALFTGILGANIFLLSFLLSGVLSDYKESEKIPGEIASILNTMADEFESSYQLKRNIILKNGLTECLNLNISIKSWLYKKKKTNDLMDEINHLYQSISRLENVIAPNYIVRLKQEHHNLRKIIIRIHTIRETDFISAGYLIATTTTCLLLLGLVLVKIEPFYESLFFIGVISYLMLFLIMLIRDLDNPFGYYETTSSEDVSLKPIDETSHDIESRISLIESDC
jgi:predicted membrane chloride channel (bestrophin family)